MESVTMYHVYKFFPPRCPKCGQPFRSNRDFAFWLGKGSSFATAMKNQKEHFPEIFPKVTTGEKAGYSNKFDIDFIICTGCQNATLRIDYASRQVATLDEAAMLVDSQGFTGWEAVVTSGNMARPLDHIAMLGQAELMMLRKVTGEARSLAAQTKDETTRVEVFSATLDSALIGIVNRIRQEGALVQVYERLQRLFGDLWEEVTSGCKEALVTAEVMKDELMSYSDTETTIDFTPAVHMYSVALEREILERIFTPFGNSNLSSILPQPTGQKTLDRSLEAMRAFVEKRRKLTLGDMAFCLLNVGCKLRDADRNGFAKFL